MKQAIPKLVNRLQEIVNGIDRHNRVNAEDLPVLSRALRMEISRLQRIVEEQRILSQNMARQLQEEESQWSFNPNIGQKEEVSE